MTSLFASLKFRNLVFQALFLVVVLGIIMAAVIEGKRNIEAQGLTSGFDFLARGTGFDVGFKLIPYDGYSSYTRLMLVGILNSLFLGLLGILAANLVGLTIAILRTARNATFNVLGTVYIEIFRNIPMILQVVFWYALLTNLPPPKQAINFFGSLISARGIYIPGLNVSAASAAVACAVVALGLIGLIVLAVSRNLSRWKHVPRARILLALGTVVAAMAVLAFGRLPDTPIISMPALRGINIRDGIRIQPEFLALWFGMAIYGGAYIAEIIRAGFLSVGKGHAEAAQSLGLTPWQVFSRIRLPLAIRAVLPTLINQYVWLFKATTLGIAIGYTDFFAAISVSINQAGQTLELIAMLMAGFLIINNSIAFVLNRVNKAVALKGSQLRT